jgi:undecaprenyl-diphosphatase
MLGGVTMIAIIKGLMRQAGQVARERWQRLALTLVFVALGCAVLVPRDLAWHRWITAETHQPWCALAQGLSVWGDYPTGTLIIAVGLVLAGWAMRREGWRTAGVACLLAASAAGLEATAVRIATGRPRPDVKMADGLYGPRFDKRALPARDFLSFPSAHSATSFGTAGALVVALPPVGIPVLLGAGGVGWSRLYKSCHYPSDVWVGAWVGLLNGVVFGLAARRLLAKSGQQ